MQYVIVLERSYNLFGPFESEQKAGEYLTDKGFNQCSDYWIRYKADFQEVVLAHIRPLRPPATTQS